MEGKPSPHERVLSPLNLALVSVLIGVVAGLGAVFFRGLIAFFHNLLFLGKFSVSYDANVHTVASPWGLLVVIVPVLGALGVVFLVKNFAPEAKGHGVPEVMDAIYYNKGVIRPVVAAVKSLASALSIGSGGSVGREGPIIQIGSSFGSTVSQFLKTPTWQRITLIAAGGGGGIAATFNTPIGGILFAMEIMMHEVSVRTLIPVAISTAVATYVGNIFFGSSPSFVIPKFETPYFELTDPLTLVTYVGLGLLIGVVSAVYVKSIYSAEDFFEKRIKGSYYVRHILGMLLVGIIMVVMLRSFGHYYIEGVGYATVQDILTGALARWDLLLLLFVLKLLVTSLTLGSGASGGVFSPALFMGATLGGVYGIFLERLLPGLAIDPPAFAVAGMAGVVGGSTGAVLAAITMIFEMTLDYNVIIPMTITVAISYGIRKALSSESIYTLKLARRGHHIPDALQTNVSYTRQTGEVMNSQFAFVSASMTIDEFLQTNAEKKVDFCSWFVVKDDSGVVGVLMQKDAVEAEEAEKVAGTTTIGQIAQKKFVVVKENVLLFNLITEMRSQRASTALVTSDENEGEVAGLIFKEQLADVWLKTHELFAE